MAKIDEIEQGGKKSEYTGNHVEVTESGHMIEYDNTPGDRRIHIYHASGTHMEIKDDGVRISKIEGKEQQFFNKGKDETVTGNFNLIINGDFLVKVTGTYKVEAAAFEMVTTSGDLNLKSAGNMLREVSGDERVQVNGKTSHRSSGDREEITGGKKLDTINKDLTQTVGTDSTQIVSGDNTVVTGGEHSISAAGTMGLGATEIGIASTTSATIFAGGAMTFDATGDATLKSLTKVETKVVTSGVQVTAGKVRVTKAAHVGVATLNTDAGPTAPATKFL